MMCTTRASNGVNADLQCWSRAHFLNEESALCSLQYGLDTTNLDVLEVAANGRVDDALKEPYKRLRALRCFNAYSQDYLRVCVNC